MFWLKLKIDRNSKRTSNPVNNTDSWKEVVWALIKLMIILTLAGIVIFPLFYMINLSLVHWEDSMPGVIDTRPGWNWSNYTEVFKDGYWRALIASAIVTSGSIVSQLTISALIGYAFAMKKWRFKKLFWGFYLSLLMLPQLALLAGLTTVVLDLNWHLGSMVLVTMFIPYAASVMTSFMFKNAFEAIPDRIKESAMVDESNGFKTFFLIALPMTKPAMWTSAILTAFASWNAYTWPTILFNLGDPSSVFRPLSLWLFSAGSRDIDDTLVVVPAFQLAGAVLTTAPLFLTYFAFRKKIMRAISKQGSTIKG